MCDLSYEETATIYKNSGIQWTTHTFNGVPSSILSARLTLDVIFHQALQAARWLGELARIDTVPSQPPKVTQ